MKNIIKLDEDKTVTHRKSATRHVESHENRQKWSIYEKNRNHRYIVKMDPTFKVTNKSGLEGGLTTMLPLLLFETDH